MAMVDPVLAISHFRGRNDDGTETTATWKAAVDTDFTAVSDQNFRIRLAVEETAGGKYLNPDLHFQYRHVQGTNTWTDVTTTSSVLRAFSSSNFTHQDSTTQQISAFTFITPNEGMTDTGEVITTADPESSGIEIEACVQIRSADVADGDTIEVRCTVDTAVPGGTLNLPLITASVPNSFTLSADTQTYSVSGVGNAFLRGHVLGAETQTYSVAGTANLNRQLVMPATTQTFSVAGVDVAFEFTSANFTLTADTQTYAVAGVDVALDKLFTLQADPATFTVSGVDPIIFSPWTADANHFTVDEQEGGGPVSPDSVGTLLLWLDATDTTTLWQDAGKTTPADTPNDPISLWEDKSGNANHYTRPATTERPFYREDFNTSYPSVWFDGFNDSLFGSMSEPANDWTILAVVDANNSTGYIADWQTGRLLLGHSSNQFGYNDGAPVTGATLPNAPSITTFRLNSPSGSVQINQTETASGSYTQRALGGSSALGERYSADNFQWSGWISSLIIYQGNLSESEIAGVEAYLADRYGISGIGTGGGGQPNHTADGWHLDPVTDNQLQVTTAAFTVTGEAALNYERRFAADTQTFTVSGVDVAYLIGYSLAADTQTFAVTGIDVAFNTLSDVTLDADTQTITVTGVDVAFQRGYVLDADTQSIAVSGVDIAYSADYRLPAETQTYAVTGAELDIRVTGAYPATTTSYTVGGVDVALQRSLRMDATTQTFTVSGVASDLTREYTLSADTQTITVSGVSAQLNRSFTLTADTQTFSVSGITADLQLTRKLSAETNSILVAGQAVSLTATLGAFPANTSAFTVSGVDVALQRGLVMQAETASVAVTGVDIEYLMPKEILIDTATFVVSGVDVALSYNPPFNRRVFIVT